TKMSDNEIGKLVRRISKSESKKAFLGYASAFESIVVYLDKNEPDFRFQNVTAVIAMSEAINENTKKLVKKYFGAHCVSRYSNVENGIIGQQENEGSTNSNLNHASYAIEILEFKSTHPVKHGFPGRIVI